jgi:hypothetical protein
MSVDNRKRQGQTVARWLWTTLTGTPDELRGLGGDAYEDVRQQVTEQRPRRVLNEGHTVEPPDREHRR